jgi:hypothetical protein
MQRWEGDGAMDNNRWIMRQAWRNILFLHWPVDPEILKLHIPDPLEMDTFEGSAWIGIVAFSMQGIYFRGLPFVSVVRPFSEVNVRTYVNHNGKPGVFFMSLDVDDWASLNIAKRWYRLPYHPADISIRKTGGDVAIKRNRKGSAMHETGTVQIKSVRKAAEPVAFQGRFTPSGSVFFPEAGTLDHFLTERYGFYTTHDQLNIYCGDIHHPPWPLQKAGIQIDRNTLFSPFHIDVSDQTPIAHFSEGVDSLMWNCKKLPFR